MGFQVQFSSPSSRFVESNEMMGLASRQTRNGRLDYFYRYIDDREVLFLTLDSVPRTQFLFYASLSDQIQSLSPLVQNHLKIIYST